MYLTKIGLNQWRCFEKAEVDLNRPFTLVAGVNGAGKTSLLKAIELGMSHGPVPGKGGALYAYGEWGLSSAGVIEKRHRSPFIEYRFAENQSAILAALEPRTPVPDSDLSRIWLRLARTMKRQMVLLFVDDVRSAPEQDYDYDAPLGPEGYECWNRAGAPWPAIERWLAQQTQVGYERFYRVVSENRGAPKLEELVPELTAASQAIADVIGESARVEYDVQHKKLLIHLGHGHILEPSQLSAGYRTLLALISDLARRCVLLNPNAGARAPYETPGLVLIDELELHLHPKWQRQVVKGLQRAFPKIQFICTTHSPQILAEAPPDSVVLLGPADTVVYPKYTHGRDANAILEEILGTPARPVDIDERFNAFRAALDEERWSDAEQLLIALEGVLGSDTAEIVSAHWSLEALRPESSQG